MLKKSFLAIFFAFAIVLVGSFDARAEAGEVYVGNYSSGNPVYLLTHTVNIQSYNPYTFTCTVRAGRDYLDYVFFPKNGSPYYRNSEGYEAYVHGGQSPVAATIYSYVVNHW